MAEEKRHALIVLNQSFCPDTAWYTCVPDTSFYCIPVDEAKALLARKIRSNRDVDEAFKAYRAMDIDSGLRQTPRIDFIAAVWCFGNYDKATTSAPS